MRKKSTVTEEPLQQTILQLLDDGKTKDILTIDLKGKTSLADCLIIASGTSTRQVIALADTLSKKLKEKGIKSKIEGKEGSGEWVILDVGDVIVHLFCPKTREFYEIETLWGHKTPKQN